MGNLIYTLMTPKNITLTEALDTVRTSRNHSEASWSGAVDGAEIDDDCANGPKHTAACKARDACLAAYDHAIIMLEVMSEVMTKGWREAAVASLEEACTLESEYGDSCDAHEALGAVRMCCNYLIID
jgi:hypothetical protein